MNRCRINEFSFPFWFFGYFLNHRHCNRGHPVATLLQIQRPGPGLRSPGAGPLCGSGGTCRATFRQLILPSAIREVSASKQRSLSGGFYAVMTPSVVRTALSLLTETVVIKNTLSLSS
jgi:hypothetical protein